MLAVERDPVRPGGGGVREARYTARHQDGLPAGPRRSSIRSHDIFNAFQARDTSRERRASKAASRIGSL